MLRAACSAPARARARPQVRCKRSSRRAASSGSSANSGAISVPTSPAWLTVPTLRVEGLVDCRSCCSPWAADGSLSVTQAARTTSQRHAAPPAAPARCEGFRVESPDGYVGVVEAVRYSPSTRWDHPSELAVYAGRSSETLLIIPWAEVERVCLAERRVVLR